MACCGKAWLWVGGSALVPLLEEGEQGSAEGLGGQDVVQLLLRNLRVVLHHKRNTGGLAGSGRRTAVGQRMEARS